MKKIFLTIIVTFVFISCKSQIVSLDANYWEYPLGTYIKDINLEMDKFVGTWVYNDGANSFNLIIEKKVHIYNGEYYEDFLVGEYSYTSGGVEIVNTLPSLTDLANINGDNNNIQGALILPSNMYPACPDCSPSERRFQLSFHDPERNYLSLSLVLRYLPQLPGESEKMTATLVSNHGGMIPDENSPTEPRVPLGEYLMIKE